MSSSDVQQYTVNTSSKIQLFLVRGLVAIVWAAAFAAVAGSVDTGVTVAAGVLVVLYPLIDVVASLVDARTAEGRARRVLREDAAVSAVVAVVLAVAATVSTASVLAVFGVWAGVSGAAQLVTAVRRRAQYGTQWPMLLAGAGSVVFGIAFIAMATAGNAMIAMIALYAATGGVDFIVQAGLLARRRQRVAAVAA